MRATSPSCFLSNPKRWIESDVNYGMVGTAKRTPPLPGRTEQLPIGFLSTNRLLKVSVDVIEVEAIGMAEVLNSLVRLHPLAPPVRHLPLPPLRERRTAVGAGAARHEHAHVLLMQRRRRQLAINGAEVSGLLLEEVVARSDGLRRTSLAAPRASGSSRRAGR